jgi:hypothetical protein
MALSQRAIFPLNTVLFPGAYMHLVIFEPRYLDMVSYCLRHQLPFIVSRLIEGMEVADKARFESIGCFAHIVDFDQREDGILMIKVLGGNRVCILSSQTDPHYLNLTDNYRVLPEVDDIVLPVEVSPLKDLLLKLARLPEVDIEISEGSLDSAEFVVHQLAQVLPLELEFKQYLLEENDSFEKCIELFNQLISDSFHNDEMD